MLIWVEHEKRFITSGQDHIAKRLAKRQAPSPHKSVITRLHRTEQTQEQGNKNKMEQKLLHSQGP